MDGCLAGVVAEGWFAIYPFPLSNHCAPVIAFSEHSSHRPIEQLGEKDSLLMCVCE